MQFEPMKWAAPLPDLNLLALCRIFLSPAFAGLKLLRFDTWGLRPRLYAWACYAGLKADFLCKATLLCLKSALLLCSRLCRSM